MNQISRWLAAVCAALALACGSSPPASYGDDTQQDPSHSEPFDLLIAGGRVMDGTGNPWFAADVGVRDGRIAAVGPLRDAPAERRIDAREKIVAPGFIDLHSHAAAGLLSEDPRRRAAPNLVSQGITTVVINQDGASMHPLSRQIELLQRQPRGPHVILLAGHNAIRDAVLKNDFRRAATAEEIGEMRRHVREAMQQGAFGLSAGLEYPPGIWSTTAEVIALVEEIAPFDGVFVVHERSSGTDPFWYFPSRHQAAQPTMIDNILELIEVAESTGAKVVATHIKARGARFWGSSRVMIKMIDDARARGLRIYADQYPYNSSGSDGRLVLIPPWLGDRLEEEQPGGDAPPDYAAALARARAEGQLAADLRRDIDHEIARRGGAENIVVMEHPDQEYLGKNLRQLAERADTSAVEVAIRLQLEGYPDRLGGARLRSFSLSEIDVEAFARQPWTATTTDGGIALPDDGPLHPRFYGTYPRKIRHYAMDRGIMTVEDAIRSSTSLPAQILGLRDRGYVRAGCHADLVVFDPARIRDLATFEDDHQLSQGIEYVLVGGQFVVDREQLTGTLPGSVIKKTQ